MYTVNIAKQPSFSSVSPSLGGVFSGRQGYLSSAHSVPTNMIKPANTSSGKTVLFSGLNLASSQQSANIRWASAQEAVNFMDHLYFITNLILEYLLENELPQELLNQTLLNDPLAVLYEHRNELVRHFHRLLIAACTCLCIGISIPLFGFMIACCWCASSKDSNSKRSPRNHHQRSRHSSGGRPSSRSRGRHRDSDSDWLALSVRDSAHSDRGQYRASDSGGLRPPRNADHRYRRRGHNHRRSASSSGASLNGNYRSRSVPPSLRYESTCHPFLRTFFASNFFVTLLLISFFTVCAFVTNEYISSGVKQLPRALNHSFDDMQTYLNNTEYEIDNLFRLNFNQLENEISNRLDKSGTIIKQKLAVRSEAIALINLTDIVSELSDTKVRLERLDNELLKLKSRLSTANKGLNDFRKKIEECPIDQCQLLRRKYQNLDNFKILPYYEKLPDVKPLIKKVSQLIDSGIIAKVQKGRDDFEKFGTIIQREVNGTKPALNQQMSIVGKKLSNLANDINQSIRWSDQLFNQTRASTKKMSQYTEYEYYRWYACLAGALVILFILLCYTIGWLYGSCRPQPTSRTYKTRVKTSASASFPFSCGIFTVFLVFLPMIVAAIGLFLTGSIGDKIVCRVIKNPEQRQSKQIYAMLQNKFMGTDLPISASTVNDDRVMLERVDGEEYKVYRPNIADLLTRCHQNQSLYKVLKLDQYSKVYLMDDMRGKRISIGFDKSFNMNSPAEFKRINNIDSKLRQLINQVEIDSSRVILLSDDAEMTLTNVVGPISFDDMEESFSRLYENGVSISPIDIETLIKDIQAQRAVASPDVESDLSWVSILASNFQNHLLPNITSSLLSLKDGVRHLKLRMFHGRNSFSVVIQDLIPRIRSAEKQLRTNGSTLIKLSANEFVDELHALIDQYTNHVKSQIDGVIGQCEPLSRAINSTAFALCDDIILPFNGYWLSAIASLILILPATLLAYALKGLYSLSKRSAAMQHNYSYTDQEDELSYEDDSEDLALAYHLGHHSHLSNKPSGSSAMPSAPLPADDGWSPTSSGYIHNSRPPPYAV